MSIEHNLPETIHAPYSPRLPSGTRPGRRFEPLKRRTKGSPPPPWDGAGMADYWTAMRRSGAALIGDAPPDIWHTGLTARLRAMAPGSEITIPRAGTDAGRGRVNGTVGKLRNHGLIFTTKTVGADLVVMRME